MLSILLERSTMTNNGNGQHETNGLLKQILDIAQNTLETQNIQLEVFQRFDRRMDHIEQRVDHMDQRMDGIDRRLDRLAENQEVTNQHLKQFIVLSDRNFKQADENFTLTAGHLKDISDKLDHVIDLEERMKKVEENVAFLMRKVG